MLIEQPARFLRWIYPHAIWRMDPSSKVIYLTFDDGPIPEATPFVLDTLDHYGIKATFFMVGDNVRKHPDVFAEVAKRGHRIGNHTFNHIGCHRGSLQDYIDNTEKANQIIGQQLISVCTDNTAPLNLFRPPHGWMSSAQYRTLRKMGYKIIMWDLVTRDYSRRLTAADVVDNVKQYARNGSIVTFHDSLRSINKLQIALPQSLEWLIQQGFTFKTL